MSETLHDRCLRICGATQESCFNEKPKMLTCLSDMLINKAYGLSAVLDMLKTEDMPDSATELLEESIDITDELITWVKYLQLTRDLKHSTVSVYDNYMAEKRESERFLFPDILNQHITLKILCDDEMKEAELVNFTPHGIHFICDRKVKPEETIQVELNAVHTDKSLRLNAVVKYSKDKLVGAAIENPSSKADLNFFDSVISYVSETLLKLENPPKD